MATVGIDPPWVWCCKAGVATGAGDAREVYQSWCASIPTSKIAPSVKMTAHDWIPAPYWRTQAYWPSERAAEERQVSCLYSHQ